MSTSVSLLVEKALPYLTKTCPIDLGNMVTSRGLCNNYQEGGVGKPEGGHKVKSKQGEGGSR